jgi:sulfur-carrier protein
MTVRLLYFAWVREKLGRSEESLELPPAVTTIAELMTWLAQRDPEYFDVFSRVGIVRAAIDQVHAQPTSSIGRAREIAFFPPVTGG